MTLPDEIKKAKEVFNNAHPMGAEYKKAADTIYVWSLAKEYWLNRVAKIIEGYEGCGEPGCTECDLTITNQILALKQEEG